MTFSVQCCLEPIGQHCTRLLPVQCCPHSIKTILNRNFSCAMWSWANWTKLHKIFTCVMLSQEYWDNIKQEFFQCNVVWNLLDNIAQRLYLCNVVSRVLLLYWTEFFHVQFFLEALGEHCKRFLPVQCCPKSIKTTLNRVFSCAMFSGANWTTLDKVFTCAMLSQYKSIKTTLSRFFPVWCFLEALRAINTIVYFHLAKNLDVTHIA